ncbi:MAG: CpaE family protein [Phycisphaerae bacterium]
MYMQLSAVIVESDLDNRRELADFLTGLGVAVVAQLPDQTQLTGILSRNDAPQVAIINLDPSPVESLRRLQAMPREFPDVSFFVMSTTVEAQLLMEAMHYGVKEFVPLPVTEERLSAALERVSNSSGIGKRGRIIHLIPTIGGCGTTTVACNLAASLAQEQKTVLMDLDLMRGGVSSYFDVRSRYTIADVMESAETVDHHLLDNALTEYRKSKLAILARPDLPEDSQRVSAKGMGRLLNMLSRMFEHTVIDSQMSIDPVYSTAIRAADINVIVMQLNVPSAKNAERFVGCLRRMGIESSKIRIVVNRFVRKGWDIAPEEVERSLGLRISWMVPNDYKTAINAINFGEPVVLRTPRSEMSQSLVQLARMLDQPHGEQSVAA